MALTSTAEYGKGAGTAGGGTSGKKLSSVSIVWHERLATYLIEHPGATLQELSVAFGKSPAWISHIRNTDAFREYFNARTNEHFSAVSADLREGVEAMTELAVTEISSRLAEGPDELSLDALTQISDLGLRNLGFGRQPGPGVQIGDQYTIIAGDQEALERARAKLQQHREQVIDVEIEEERETAASDQPPALPAAE